MCSLSISNTLLIKLWEDSPLTPQISEKNLQKQQIFLFVKETNFSEGKNNERKEEKRELINRTHAIFSDGDRHGSSSSSSLSSLFSPSSKPSSPEMLNDEDVNISGTGRIDGLRLPFILSVDEKNKAIKC